MDEEQTFLLNILKDAINDVYNENRLLLKFETQSLIGLEQAFAFRVGLHLFERLKHTEYKVLDLDAEYNKSIGQSKMLEEFEDGIRPDLILHERGNHINNKLAVEFKGYWNKLNEKDLRKLVGLTSPNGDYNYTLGVFVNIGESKATFRIYINGFEI
ncbi:MAG TPA: hypothetical protein PLZ32_08105 [Saprospiraceae bacterium]|nr:hypothetical protein [Saprospiraceae bacterium]